MGYIIGLSTISYGASFLSFTFQLFLFIISPGANGIQGPEGLKGESGGECACDEAVGPYGEPGQPGLRGLPGNNGYPGLPGIRGDRGDNGDTGADGVPGADVKYCFLN